MVQEYVLAATPEEAAELIAGDPEAVVMGGGTTLMPKATLGELNGRRVIGLARAGLDYVERNGATRIGAMTPLRALGEIGDVPGLAEAARSIGSWPLRVSATVGGNLLAPPPYGDLAPVLLALDAEIRVAGSGGERTAPLAEAIEAGPAGPGELLLEVGIPAAAGSVSYRRCARRELNAPPIVTVAVRVWADGDAIVEARVAIGAVGPRPLRVGGAEAALSGSTGDAGAIDAAVAAGAAAVEAVDDAVASAWYRRRMTELHLRRAIEAAVAAERG